MVLEQDTNIVFDLMAHRISEQLSKKIAGVEFSGTVTCEYHKFLHPIVTSDKTSIGDFEAELISKAREVPIPIPVQKVWRKISNFKQMMIFEYDYKGVRKDYLMSV